LLDVKLTTVHKSKVVCFLIGSRLSDAAKAATYQRFWRPMPSPLPPSGDPLVPETGPELMIGLVAPVGVDPSYVITCLNTEFAKVGYNVEEVRLSELLHALQDYSDLASLKGGSEFERIAKHMEAGTQIRNRTKRGDTIALLAIAEIRRRRQAFHRRSLPANENDDAVEKLSRTPIPRTVYILNSLKHPHEIDLLRDVYGQAFLVVSIYSPRENRIDFLSKKISD